MIKKLGVLTLVLIFTLSLNNMVLATGNPVSPGIEQIKDNPGNTETEEETADYNANTTPGTGENEPKLVTGPVPSQELFGMGLHIALDRVKANGSPVAQKVLEKLIESQGDIQSVAQTLGDMAQEELEDIDEKTREDLEKVAEELEEKIEQEKEQMENEDKKQVLAKIAEFYNNMGSREKALANLEEILKFMPQDLATYQEIGQIYKKMGNEELKAFVNGQQPVFDVKPRVQNGRTLVPFRALGEALGATINWDPSTQTVSFKKGDNVVQLPVGENSALVNGRQYTLDVPAFIENGRTLVPLRFISEALKAKVQFLPDTQMVIVTE
jgi:tetratricopeptide (TPR) repeat protein